MFMDQKNQYIENEYTTKVYRFNGIPSKLPILFFTELEQIISQFVWKYKKNLKSQSNLEKQKSNWRNQPAWLQALLQSYSHQKVWYWHKDRNVDQWNKIECPEINPCTNGHLIFEKGGKNTQWRKDNFFNKCCWENWSTICKRMRLECFLRSYTKINSKLIKYLNIRPETIKFLEENISKTLSDINHSRIAGSSMMHLPEYWK